MAEYVNPQEGTFKEGHFPNTSNALLELYRLLTIFLASKNFATLLTNDPGVGFDPFYQLQEVESDEITRLLLSLAITARVIDDRENRVLELIGSNCGEFQRDIQKSDTEILDLREACNKIIHAKKKRCDIDEINGQTYLNPFMYLYGEQGPKHWKAKLDIVSFAKEYVTLLSNF